MSPERVEYLMLQIARLNMDPKLPSATRICRELGISKQLYDKLRDKPLYVSLCEQLLKPIRDKYEGQIQAVLINRALKGSKWHMDTYYNLQDRLSAKKLEVTHKTISDDPKEVDDEIGRLTSEIEMITVASQGESKSDKRDK